MELEFLNTEKDFDFSWLPENMEEDSIGSKDVQEALDNFCDAVCYFLSTRCPDYADRIESALKPGRSFHEIYTHLWDNLRNHELWWTISDWMEEVFLYQLRQDSYQDSEQSSIPHDVKAFLDNPEKNDRPRRVIAWNRLEAAMLKVRPFAGLDAVNAIKIDMTDWDKRAA